MKLKPGDTLLLEGEQEALDKMVSQGKLALTAHGGETPVVRLADGDMAVVYDGRVANPDPKFDWLREALR